MRAPGGDLDMRVQPSRMRLMPWFLHCVRAWGEDSPLWARKWALRRHRICQGLDLILPSCEKEMCCLKCNQSVGLWQPKWTKTSPFSVTPFPISLALTPSDSASLIFKKSGKIKDELATIQQTLQTDYQLPIFPFFLTNKIPNPFMATMCPARKLHFPASLATTDHVTPLQPMKHKQKSLAETQKKVLWWREHSANLHLYPFAFPPLPALKAEMSQEVGQSPWDISRSLSTKLSEWSSLQFSPGYLSRPSWHVRKQTPHVLKRRFPHRQGFPAQDKPDWYPPPIYSHC